VLSPACAPTPGQRRVVAQALSGEGDHPDVLELYRLALAIDGKISIATVYRTVRLFEEKGILSRLDFGGGRARYEPSDHGPHHHLIDIDSGEVCEFQDDALQTRLREITIRLGFEPVSHRLELFGRRTSQPPNISGSGKPPGKASSRD
jgi:Fur family ferric uptake transcriptional regulator